MIFLSETIGQTKITNEFQTRLLYVKLSEPMNLKSLDWLLVKTSLILENTTLFVASDIVHFVSKGQNIKCRFLSWQSVDSTVICLWVRSRAQQIDHSFGTVFIRIAHSLPTISIDCLILHLIAILLTVILQCIGPSVHCYYRLRFFVWGDCLLQNWKSSTNVPQIKIVHWTWLKLASAPVWSEHMYIIVTTRWFIDGFWSQFGIQISQTV